MDEKLFLGNRKLSKKGEGYVLSIPRIWQKYKGFDSTVRIFIVGENLVLEPIQEGDRT